MGSDGDFDNVIGWIRVLSLQPPITLSFSVAMTKSLAMWNARSAADVVAVVL